MTIQAVVPAAPAWFKPAGQDEESAPAEFKVKPLTQPELLEVETDGFDQQRRRFLAHGFLTAVRYGLLDWRGVLDADGKELKFSRAAIAQLPRAVLAEVAIRVIEISQLSEAERKN